MSDTSNDGSAAANKTVDERLDSWKAIAAHLRRDVTTVQRWEKTEGLPVHRHLHGKLASVYAFRSEVDAWWNSRRVRLQNNLPPDWPAEKTFRRPRLTTVARVFVSLILVVAVFASATWWTRGRSRMTPPTPRYVQATFEGNVDEATLSPDGNMVAAVLRGSPMRLLIRDVSSGSATDVAQAPLILRPKWSPDGFEVAMSAHSFVTIVPRLGGSPTTLPGLWGAWAPDGKRFASMAPIVQGFRVFGRDGLLKKEVLIRSVKWMVDLDWSRATDRLLVWTEDEGHNTILWSMASDGTDARRLYAPVTRLLGAAWSPDGNAVYLLRPAGDTSDLVRIPTATHPGQDEQVLIRGLSARKGIAVSADGTKLLFTRSTSGANIWHVTVNDPLTAESVTSTRLTRGTSRFLLPVISPDGRAIAFVRGDGMNSAIQRSALNLESVPETVTSSDLRADDPAWSPDGGAIAFTASSGGEHSLWTIGANGGKPQRIRTLHPLAVGEDSLVWAPDGRLAYHSADQRMYYLLNPATGEEQPLGEPSAGFMYSPRFSADGSSVAVLWNRPGASGLWTIELRTHRETHIGNPIRPLGWAPDGRAIYGRWILGDKPEIVRVELATGSSRVLTHFPSGVVSSGWVSRDGRHIVCSVGEEISDAWIIEHFDPQ